MPSVMVREEVVEGEDVHGDERADDEHDQRESDDGLAARPRDLLQLSPALLGELNEADPTTRQCRCARHYRPPSARRERLELSTTGFGDQCSAS